MTTYYITQCFEVEAGSEQEAWQQYGAGEYNIIESECQTTDEYLGNEPAEKPDDEDDE